MLILHGYPEMTYSGSQLYISQAKFELKNSQLYLLFNALYSCVTRVETDVIVDPGEI
jgi:hypothetical protein